MAYTPKEWVDGEAGGTPITAAELNRMEAGIEAVDQLPEPFSGSYADLTDKPTIPAATAAGTRAQLDAGTDTTVRAFSAKDIAEYVTAQINAIP